MMSLSVAEIAQATAGRLTHCGGDGAAATVGSVCTDSREAGPGSLFVAIAGDHVDGHDFVRQVREAGAVAALVTREQDVDIPQIVVPDTVTALGAVAKATVAARRATGRPFTVIGITGSVGKTTTKDLIRGILSTQAPTVAPVGSFNNEIGLPLTATKVDADTRYLVAEMGASAIGEIRYLASLVPPDIAVVLKVGVAHLGGFGSVENIRRAKAEIVQALPADGVAVLNADDPRVATMADMTPASTVRWFGIAESNNPCDVRATNVTVDGTDRPEFDLVTPEGQAHVHLALRGRHNVMNALAATTVALRLGVPLEDIVSVLDAQTAASPHRMAVSTVSLPGHASRDGGASAGACFTLIDDSFNANPDSMKAGLDGLAAWHAEGTDTPYRIAVLGSMLELGDDDDAKHRDIGAYCQRLGIDAIVCVGSDTDPNLDRLAADFADGARAADTSGRMHVELVHGADEADRSVTALAADHPGSVVLLKGSHASGLSGLATRWTSQAAGSQKPPAASRAEGDNA